MAAHMKKPLSRLLGTMMFLDSKSAGSTGATTGRTGWILTSPEDSLQLQWNTVFPKKTFENREKCYGSHYYDWGFAEAPVNFGFEVYIAPKTGTKTKKTTVPKTTTQTVTEDVIVPHPQEYLASAMINYYPMGDYYLNFKAFKGNLSRAAILITVLCIIYIVVVSKFKERYWIDTILAFPLGCLVSLFKDKLSFKKHMLWFVAFAVCVLLLVAAKNGLIPTFYGRTQSALFAFSAALVLLSMRVKINSKVLSWFGSQVFGIYILQRLPMNFGKHLHWNEQNIYLYFLFCLAVTLLLAIAFNKATSWLDSKLFKKP